MMADWTPGPWTASCGNLVRTESGRHVVICSLHKIGKQRGKEHEDEIVGNADLIAAAPEMYEALKPFADAADDLDNHNNGPDDIKIDYLGECDITVGDCRKARAALAKARGEHK